MPNKKEQAVVSRQDQTRAQKGTKPFPNHERHTEPSAKLWLKSRTKKRGPGKEQDRTEEKDQELTCVGIKPNGILCSSAASEAERDGAASGDWQELGENGMRRGSADHRPNDQENSELGKEFQTPGGGLLNKRRERQSCAINFVCTSLSLSLDLYLQLGPSRSMKRGPWIA